MNIAVQLYSTRTLLDQDVSKALADIAALGYRYAETGGFHGLTPAAFKAAADSAGLTIISAHVGLDMVRDRIQEAVETAQALEITNLVVPWLNIAEIPGGWVEVADVLNEGGEKLLSQGIRLGYHNHDFEFKQYDGQVGFELLWEHLDPELVFAELDLCWVQVGGQSPVEWLNRMSGNAPLAHFKDWNNGTFADVGRGELDFPAIIAAADAAEVEFAIVEHDNPSDPLASMKASHDYLVSQGLTD